MSKNLVSYKVQVFWNESTEWAPKPSPLFEIEDYALRVQVENP
jgi:hypothetical protein